MAGDITRSTFRKPKHYSGVRMQQGRVQMDADWNEQLDIRLYTERTTNRDVIGACGAPEENAANANFAVQVQPGGNLLIKQGRIYVGGILCETETDVLIAAPTPTGSISVQPDLPGVEFVGPGFAFEPLLAALGGGPGFTLPSATGTYSAYLDVWEREITVLEDPSIREVALGGPDTATRRKVVWQAKLLFLNEATTGVSCPTDWDSLIPPSTGTLAARATPDPPNTNPCAVPATAGFRRLENQLYRVEIHEGGNVGAATFKFSRDNASVTAGWLGQDSTNPNNLLVSTLGRDQVLGFSGGQWIELTDDTRELWGLPGTLVQLQSVQVTGQGPTLTIVPGSASPPGPVKFTDFPRNPKVRRWDQVATPTVSLTGGAIAVKENQWLDLEDGVQVRFEPGGFYRTGDYWLIPARTSTAITNPLVEWPVDSSTSPPTPIQKPAFGIRHSYCALALLQFNPTGGFTFVADCRDLFPPLTDICAKDVCFDNKNCALPGAKTVQDAIDQLCKASQGGCCTVTVSPKDVTPTNTLQQIVDAVAGKQATICMSPGVYTLSAPLVLTAKHNNMTIEGCHPDVVIRADSTAPPRRFLQGLFVLAAADRITIGGLEFDLPAIPFAENGGRLADLPVAVMLERGMLDIRRVQVGIGIRAMHCADLHVEDCTFKFQVQQLTIFEAGIFAGGTCNGLTVRNNSFVHEAPVTPLSTEVRCGILHTSTVSKAAITQAPAALTVTGAILPARLDGAYIAENSFSGLTAAAFIHAEMGLVRLEGNRVANCNAGFELFSLRYLRNDPTLAKYVNILHDLVFALIGAMGEGYPLPDKFDPVAAGQITVTPQPWVPATGTSPDPVVASAFVLDSLYAAVEGGAFPNLLRSVPPLSFMATENDIDATSTGPAGAFQFFGAGLVVGSEGADTNGTVVISANRVRIRGNLPGVAVLHAIFGSVAGNAILNDLDVKGLALVVAPATSATSGGPPPLVSFLAITGNLLRGSNDLPPHIGAAPPLDRWEVLNQLI